MGDLVGRELVGVFQLQVFAVCKAVSSLVGSLVDTLVFQQVLLVLFFENLVSVFPLVSVFREGEIYENNTQN